MAQQSHSLYSVVVKNREFFLSITHYSDDWNFRGQVTGLNHEEVAAITGTLVHEIELHDIHVGQREFHIIDGTVTPRLAQCCTLRKLVKFCFCDWKRLVGHGCDCLILQHDKEVVNLTRTETRGVAMLQMPLHTWFVGAHWHRKKFPALPGFNYWFPTCRRLAPDFALFPEATGIHTHRYHSVLTKKREVGRYRSTERADTWGHYFKRIRAERGLLH